MATVVAAGVATHLFAGPLTRPDGPVRAGAFEIRPSYDEDHARLLEHPGDVALVLSQQQHTRDLVDDLSRVMSLAPGDRELLHQEIVGAVGKVVDDYLAVRPTPKG